MIDLLSHPIIVILARYFTFYLVIISIVEWTTVDIQVLWKRKPEDQYMQFKGTSKFSQVNKTILFILAIRGCIFLFNDVFKIIFN